MFQCEKCGARSPEAPSGVVVASESELRNPHYIRDLRAAVAAERLPRRLWRDAIADTLRDFAGAVLKADRTPWEVPEIDDHFPEDDDQRWVSDFARPLAEGKPFRMQGRVIERVRLIDLFFRIRHPELAATFGRPRSANDNAAGSA